MTATTTRILLADDHTILRAGLRALLEANPSFSVIAEVGSGREAINQARRLNPDVVLMDVAMPDLNGIEATRQIRAHSQEIAIIALSMHTDRRYVIEMLKAGARGYLLKDCAYEELERAVHVVTSGQAYLSPGVSDAVVSDYIERLCQEAPNVELSLREREVLQLIAEGKNSRAIADSLRLSVRTVESHRRQIMEKLQLRNIAELTKYALREGLTSLEF